jgi:hypothetical protein
MDEGLKIEGLDEAIARFRETSGVGDRNRGNHGSPEGKQNSALSRDMRQRDIIRLAIEGAPSKKIGEMLNLNYTTVNQYLRKPDVQAAVRAESEAAWEATVAHLRNSRINMTEAIRDASEKALAKIIELMDSDDERIIYRSASDILDRNPETGKSHKVESTEKLFVIDANMLELAARAAKEIEPPTIEGVLPDE